MAHGKTISEYLAADGSMSVTQLRQAINAKSDAQVRQWQHGYDERLPGPIYCVALEQVTGGEIRRWKLRPKDWHQIWPELVGTPGAPPIPMESETPIDAEQLELVKHTFEQYGNNPPPVAIDRLVEKVRG